MTNIWRVFMYELVRNFRRRGYLFTTFGIPVLAIVLFYGWQFISSRNVDANTDPQEMMEAMNIDFRGIQTAGVVDESGLFGETSLENVKTYATREEAEAALAAGEIDAAYFLPPDYAETGQAEMVIPHLDLNKVTNAPIERLVMERFSSAADPLLLARLGDPSNINEVDLQRSDEAAPESAVRNEDTNFALIYGFAILFMLTVFGTSGYLLQSVIEEKESRLIEILISTVRPVQLLTGKVLAMGVLGLFQIVVWIGFGVYMLTSQREQLAVLAPFLSTLYVPTATLPLLLIYFVLGYMLFAAAFGAVGAISNSLQEGPQISTIFVMPALIPMFALAAFIEDPNAPLPVILSLIPLTAPLAMTMRVVATAVPFWQIALSILLTIVLVWGMFWMAGRLFRVQTLLAGKSPNVREIPKLIFGRS